MAEWAVPSPLRILMMAAVPENPNQGAAGTEYQTARALRALGHDVDTVWASDLRRRIGHGNLHQLLELPRELERVMTSRLASRDYDVVHVNQPHGYRAARRLHRSGSRAVFVHRSHGFEPLVDEVVRGWEQRLHVDQRPAMRRAASAVMRRLTLRHAAHIARDADGHLVSSTLDRDYLHERYGVPLERIAAIPQAAPDEYLAGPPPAMTAERLRNVLHVGQFAFFKAPMIVAAAMNRIAEESSDARFTWVAGQEHHGAVRSLLSAAATSRLELLPWLPQDELRSVYDRSGVFLFPSFYEGFGKVLVEAMSRGLCVVATPSGGARDLIQSGANGVLVPFGDAVQLADAALALMADRERAERIGRAAAETARPLTWEHFARQVADFYRGLL